MPPYPYSQLVMVGVTRNRYLIPGEEGPKPDKKQGLTDKERRARYSKDHSGEAVEERIKAWFDDPLNKTGCRFLLVDSYSI